MYTFMYTKFVYLYWGIHHLDWNLIPPIWTELIEEWKWQPTLLTVNWITLLNFFLYLDVQLREPIYNISSQSWVVVALVPLLVPSLPVPSFQPDSWGLKQWIGV